MDMCMLHAHVHVHVHVHVHALQGVALRLCLARAPAISFGRQKRPAAAARGSVGGDALRLEVLRALG
jgi:hypothetical protein